MVSKVNIFSSTRSCTQLCSIHCMERIQLTRSFLLGYMDMVMEQFVMET